MMKRLVYVGGLLSYTLLFFACENTPTSPEKAGLGYFPMQVGNRWTYQAAGDSSWTLQVEITGKTQIGLHSYFVFEESYSTSEQVYRRFFRPGGDGKIFINWEGQDRLYADFERSTSSAWPSFSEYIGQISQRNITSVVHAGRFGISVKNEDDTSEDG